MHPLRMVCRTCGGDGQIALTRCGLIVASRTTGSIITTERCEECDGDGWRPWPWATQLVDPSRPDRPADPDDYA